jgi:hypothetical protein
VTKGGSEERKQRDKEGKRGEKYKIKTKKKERKNKINTFLNGFNEQAIHLYF